MVRTTSRLLLAMTLAIATAVHAQVKIEALPVGPAANDVVYVVGPAGRVAAGMMKGSRFVMSVDGVEGPKVDSVMNVLPVVGVVSPPDPRSALPGFIAKPVQQTPIVFSDDGQRYAYVARVGQEYIVYLDGQEHRRFAVDSANQIRMQFTGPAGKNFMIATAGASGQFELRVNDQPQPPFAGSLAPIISRDGQRYAYLGGADPNKPELIIDGKPAGYTGDRPRFTGDSKSVLTISQTGNDRAVLLDGKPVVQSPGNITLHIAPAGDKFVAVISKPASGGARYVCVVDGKEVPATEATSEPFVVFSESGDRFAARCRSATGAPISWVVTDDGKKGQEYAGIDEASLIFSPDGKRFAYVAGAGNKQFPVIDGEEADGFNYTARVGFSPDSKSVYYGGRQDQPTVTRMLVVNGKAHRGDHNFNNESIVFSVDGSRWGALGSGLKSGGPTGLQSVANFLLDGTIVEGITVSKFIFAPNGKHVAFIGQRHKDNATGLFLDADAKPLQWKMTTRGRPPVFSTDGKHLYWSVLQMDASNQHKHMIFADGREVARFDNVGLGNFETDPNAWSVQPDGSLIAIGAVGDKVMRYRITPGDDTSAASAADALVQAEGQAAAEIAKQKADQEATAKKKQEEAQAARDAANKARQEAAAEAQRKKEEAAAARKKAAEEKKAKQGK